ncbi:KTSC domain-containing protein [Pedobacter sp. HMF7647]|uniref:KTSC domain-containing protein n=1 Tax=Hufsiella arboris TaxID=2695275 RepID=A0A7K1YE34_9SPHI|nr:KTSC domain-containing protein [Hufsiella arboris]MXV52863.1 KTSC domain-containing protein [Hufsiella arboris]
MKRYYVESSALKTLGYDEKRKILEVEFREEGAVWQYLNVSKADYKRLLQAESKGNYFVTRIKGKHAEQRIG